MKNLMRINRLLSICVLAFVVMMALPAISMAQTKKPWAKYSNGTLTFSYGAKPAGADVYEVPLKEVLFFDIPWYDKRKSIRKVIFNASFKQCENIKSTSHWFYECEKLTSIIGLNYLNTANVTNMSYMFYYCKSLTSLNLSRFNTANVTDMSSMFRRCESLTSLNLSSFNTANVTKMSLMFWECSRLTSLNLSSFNTANVTDMSYMFSDCISLTSLNLSSFNTANVTDMFKMFEGCCNLRTLNLSNFNTSNVEQMSSMFYNCKKLTSLDLSKFDMRHVKSAHSMFYSSESLKTIKVSKVTFNLTLVGRTHIFVKCPASIYDENGVKYSQEDLLAGRLNKKFKEPSRDILTICPDGYHPHMIDLGLPSGTKWACCNLGADSPDEKGSSYSWLDTHSACADWGGSWRVPTEKDYKELMDYAGINSTQINGVGGVIITHNKGKIFLPATYVGSVYEGEYWSSSTSVSDLAKCFCFTIYYLNRLPDTKLSAKEQNKRFAIRPVFK